MPFGAKTNVAQPSAPIDDCIWMSAWNWLFGPNTLMLAPISVPAPLRAASSWTERRTIGATLSFARTMGLRASSCFALDANVPNAGFFVELRFKSPLCHVLVGSSRKMNQMNILTVGMRRRYSIA